MSEAAWLFVQQPNGLLARYIPAQFAFVETNMTTGHARCLSSTWLHAPSSVENKVLAALEAGASRWDNALRGIRAHHGDEFADALVARLSCPVAAEVA